MAELVINLPEPNDKQKIFLSDLHKIVSFGGARGGGKSFVARYKAILLGLNYSGIKMMILRRTYPELQENHIKPLLNLLPVGSYKYNDGKKELRFPNGSQILFRYCNGDKDLLNFQGLEIDILFIDEATQFTEEQFKVLSACVRGVNNFPKRIYLTCNPGGIGHQWVKRLFIDRNYNSDENPDDYSFIQSLVTDNKALMLSQPDYVKQLEALPAKLKDAWLYGKWDIFSGQFFEEFINNPEHYDDRQWTHVIEPFDIPSHWNVYRSYDFGYAKPFSCGWWAVDEDGRLYRILELYGCTGEPNEGVKWSPDKQFAEIRKIEKEHPLLKGRNINGVADPAIWDSSRGDSINDTAVKYGIVFSKGDNQRVPGWMQMHYRFQFDDNGIPMMYIFKNCKAFIRTVPLLIYSQTHPEDLDTGMEDHVADESRYMCMSRPIKPTVKSEKRKLKDDPLNLAADGFDCSIRKKRDKMIIIEEENNGDT